VETRSRAVEWCVSRPKRSSARPTCSRLGIRLGVGLRVGVRVEG
jgi:hypothetical protein